MPSWLATYAAALLAFAIVLAGALAGGSTGKRGKAAGGWLPVIAAVGVLAGWALLAGPAGLPRTIWAPRSGVARLLAPALASAAVWALLAWRAGRQRRVLLLLEAGFAGWWIAQSSAGPEEFWRVGFVITVLTLALAWVIGGDPRRGLAASLALCAGLAVAGAGPGWIVAASVLAAAWAGLVASGSSAMVPVAPFAALIGAADLASGRLLRGRFGAGDVACLLVLAAPWVAGVIGQRLGGKPVRLFAVLAAMGAGAVVALVVWAFKHANFA